jgi:hypothetical protein
LWQGTNQDHITKWELQGDMNGKHHHVSRLEPDVQRAKLFVSMADEGDSVQQKADLSMATRDRGEGQPCMKEPDRLLHTNSSHATPIKSVSQKNRTPNSFH